MAAAMVGQAFLSASVQTLIDRITSCEFRDFSKSRMLNVSLMDELKITLLMLDAVLNDAEEKQITNPAVKEWLEELKDAVFEAEDLLDEINTHSLRSKVEQDSPNVANKVCSFLSSFGELYWGMNSKLEAMSRRLEHFAKQKDVLGLQSVSLRVQKSITTSFVNESIVVGREDEKEKLLGMLLCDEDAKGNDIGVITIWGMGGVGKTTLAQLLYNDKNVEQHFDLKAWACVSEDFNVFEITKNLVQSVTSKVYDSKNLDFLQVELNHNLSNKKFLIVLDDLWNENYNEWDDLVTPFRSGKGGSRIIVTTRQQRVAEITHTFPVKKLTPLSDENCWCLLAKHALRNEDPNRFPELQAIGRQIARKCGGLPLAAKTLGGLLRSKVDAGEWKRILNSSIWGFPNDNVLPALRLSYLYLPSHLKKCFAYCSIFPKDHLLDKNQLVLLWMAEGFVQQYSYGEKTMEIEAEEYFNELLSRALIQHYEGDPEKFVMHDLINDLARIISGKSCHCYDDSDIPKVVRHLSYPRQWYEPSKKFESFYNLNSLRTFLPHSLHLRGSLTKKVPHDLLPKLKCLRVLSLSGYQNITELPNSIGNLQHLRYLDLSYTSIIRLPDASFTLYNLQTLILSNCSYFNELPPKIENLTNLRHLDISDTDLKELPRQIRELQNLHTLSTFVVGKQQDGLKIKELKRLPHLQGKLSILNLQNVIDAMDASEANLKRKQKIEELVLEWDKDSDTHDSQIEKDVLDKLQPSTNLQRLTINYYGGTSFPNWVGDSSFANITFLCISGCIYCFSLPPFGRLPSLKKLLIKEMLVQTVGYEFYYNKAESSSFQPFPSLETLEFHKMPCWEEWLPFKGDGIKTPFPCLKHLNLRDCPKLRGDLPNNLPSLAKVDILDCYQLEAKSSASHWLTSIEELNIGEGGGGLLRALDNDSQNSLKRLEITKCESLPRMILGSTCLQHLSLLNIPSLLSFPIDGLCISLQSLSIIGCEKLEFLPQETWQNYTSLEYLTIRNSCHSLTSFPLGCFPQLKILYIENCPHLEVFTQAGVSALALERFHCSNCKKLKSMSEVKADSLATLQQITLHQLPNLETLPQCGLPLNLRSISVDGCERLSSMAIEDWGFQRLGSLLIFHLIGDGGDDILHNLLKKRLLPSSLKHIRISQLSDLKLLDGKGLQHLTNLEELHIWLCPNLESLPEDELPSSLSLLYIFDCPKLEERYDYQRGKYLSRIAHNLTIIMNNQYYDP